MTAANTKARSTVTFVFLPFSIGSVRPATGQRRRRGYAGGAYRPMGHLWLDRLWQSPRGAQDVESARTEHEHVHDKERDKRAAHGGSADRRGRIHSPKQSVYGVGLAPDLGGYPARDDGDEAGRPHGHRRP